MNSGGVAPRAARKAELNREQMGYQAEIEKIKKQADDLRERARLAARSKLEQAVDWFIKWRRMAVISRPTSILKLSAAVAEGIPMSAGRVLQAQTLGRFPGISQILDKSPLYNRGPLMEDCAAIAKGFTEMIRNFKADTGANLKGGVADYERVFGDKDTRPPELINQVGFLHGAIKSVLGRNVFETSMAKALKWYARQGADVSDPLVQMEAGRQAFEDSQWYRLQSPNIATKAYRMLVSGLGNIKDPMTGKPRLSGKVMATLLKLEVPIVNIPSNFIGRLFDSSILGLGNAGREIGMAYWRGIENLQPREATQIARHLMLGSLGTASMALGAYLYKDLGGLYQPQQKRRQDDLKFGELRVGGVVLPPYVQHNPVLYQMQIGATVMKLFEQETGDESKARKLTYDYIEALKAATREQPFIRESTEVAKLFEGKKPMATAGEHIAGMVIPGGVQQVAGWMDRDAQGETIRRRPEKFMDAFLLGVPGMREQVPETLPPELARRLHHR